MTPPIGGMDPNTYAMQYAQQNGISFDEAKQQLRAKYGDPQAPQQNFMVAGLQQFQQTSGASSAASSNQDLVQLSGHTTGASSTSNAPKTYSTGDEITSAAYDIYESGEDFGVRGKEYRQLKRQNRKYMDEIHNYAISYEREHKLSEYSGSRKEKTEQWKNDAYQYAYKKFQEAHPDIDLATVYYNDYQDATHWFAGGKNLKPYT